MTRRRTRLGVIAAVAAVATALASAVPAAAGANKHDKLTTATPIEHVVVIFQENVSFDHYFATYPRATNPTGEPRSTPRRTPPPSTASPQRCS